MVTFELRLWDGRLGRWLTVDPMGQYFSPYLGMGNNPISRIDPDGGMDTEPPRSATGLDDFFHDTSDGTYYFGNADGTWTQASTAPITVVVNQNTPNLALGMVGTLVYAPEFGSITFSTSISTSGVAAGATVGGAGIMMLTPAAMLGYLAKTGGAAKKTYSEVVASGTISSTAGASAYQPEYQPGKFDVETILAAKASSEILIHQMGKGGFQGQWDDELSPLSDDELLALLKEAIATSNNKLKQRIVKEQKRRGNRNKGKNRGRGDIK